MASLASVRLLSCMLLSWFLCFSCPVQSDQKPNLHVQGCTNSAGKIALIIRLFDCRPPKPPGNLTFLPLLRLHRVTRCHCSSSTCPSALASCKPWLLMNPSSAASFARWTQAMTPPHRIITGRPHPIPPLLSPHPSIKGVQHLYGVSGYNCAIVSSC